jgi:hypothetical protein
LIKSISRYQSAQFSFDRGLQLSGMPGFQRQVVDHQTLDVKRHADVPVSPSWNKFVWFAVAHLLCSKVRTAFVSGLYWVR